MAILNANVIQKMADEKARITRAEQEEQTKYVWDKIDLILEHDAKAIDIADTFEELRKQKLENKIKEFESGRTIHFEWSYCYNENDPAFKIKNGECEVHYVPSKHTVRFSWHGYGMHECYDSSMYWRDGNTYQFVKRILDTKRTYKDLLIAMTTEIGTYLYAAEEFIFSL